MVANEVFKNIDFAFDNAFDALRTIAHLGIRIPGVAPETTVTSAAHQLRRADARLRAVRPEVPWSQRDDEIRVAGVNRKEPLTLGEHVQLIVEITVFKDSCERAAKLGGSIPGRRLGKAKYNRPLFTARAHIERIQEPGDLALGLLCGGLGKYWPYYNNISHPDSVVMHYIANYPRGDEAVRRLLRDAND